MRILSQPAYAGSELPAAIAARLREATDTQWHAFCPDTLSLVAPGTLDWRHVLGSRQLTDVYLLAIAVHRGGRLVTLDGGIQTHAVPDAGPRHLVSILG